MISVLRLAYIVPAFTVGSLLSTVSSATNAADVSPWDNAVQSAARLIAAPARAEIGGRVFRAGVEIKLKPGWKTYWRYPGDSGVPPVFDFSKSQNVKTITVLFPAPMRFADGAGGSSIGIYGTGTSNPVVSSTTIQGGLAGSAGAGGASAPTAPVAERDGNAGQAGPAGSLGTIVLP